MRLVVKTQHEPSLRQAEMIAEYVRKENADLVRYDEDVNFIYSLTDKGRLSLPNPRRE